MPKWPAILKLHGDPELMFVGSQTAFTSDPTITELVLSPDDYLIDSDGKVFRVMAEAHNPIGISQAMGRFEYDEVMQLVREHLFSFGNTCIPKLHLANIPAAIAFIGKIE